MRAEKRHAGETAKVGGARALAGCVKIVTAFNAAMSAGAFALAVAFAVSASMLAFKSKGGVA